MRALVATTSYCADEAREVGITPVLRRVMAQGARSADRTRAHDLFAPSFSPTNPRTCWAIASSVGNRSIELAP